MKSIKRFFLSRITVLCLICLALAAITLAALVPQSFMTSPADMETWQAAHPLLGRWSGSLGLHRVYTHPVFALILAGVAVSLAFSTWEQFVRAWRLSFARREMADGAILRTALARDLVTKRLRSQGYLPVGENAGVSYLVRHPWGYWGNGLFHLGMVLVIAASLLVALTQQRGVLQLGEGETHEPTAPWTDEEKGLLARDFTLPCPIRLDRVTYSFWPNHGVKEVASTLTFLPGKNVEDVRSVHINSILTYQGIRIYQGMEFGHAFYLEVEGPGKRKEVFQLMLERQKAPEFPSYNRFRNVLGNDALLRAKYYVDAEKKSFARVDPLLVLRVDQGGRELGQLPLRVGSEGSIGPYRFRMLRFGPWSRLIFVSLSGMPGVFLGFLVICLGGIFHYFTPPREAMVCPCPDGGSEIRWRATRFATFYTDEFAAIRVILEAEERNG